MRTLHLTIVAFAGALVLGVQARQSPADWPNHGRDAGATRYSPLKQINTENVAGLQVAWTYDTPAAVPETSGPPGQPADNESAAPSTPPTTPPSVPGRPRPRQSEATPLVIDGVLYLGTAYNRVVALDADTGKEIWVKDIGHTPSQRGLAYWPGDGKLPPQLVFGTTDGSALLMALNAKTGEPVSTFGKDGKVDLRQGVGEKFPKLRVALSSPPTIYKNLVITGNHSQESPSLGPAGDIRAWDMKTGKLVWTFHTVPRPGEPNHEVWRGDQWVDRAGTNVWGFITVDEERGIAYAPIGNPATDFYGGDRLGSDLYGSTLAALDAATGKLKWYFQTTHHDNWDYDLTAPPTLIDVKRNGRTIPAVAQFTKQGLLFVFDRVTGKPIYGVEERPVVSDNPVPGDEYWPTQPFPLKPPPLSRMSFSPGEIAKVTPEHEEYCRGLLALEGGAMTGGPYAQYGPKLRVIFPGWTGGGNWNGSAFNPDLGYLFMPTQDLGMLNKMVKSTRAENMYNRVGPDNAPLNLGGNFWDGKKSWPCQQPPWGELVAVNVNTGDVAWKVPLGSFEELDALGVPPTGTPNRGGPIATAGGLVFIGASQDARFRAFDARTGKVLWVADLSENGRTVPITYQGKSGKQYVAIMAGGLKPVARKVDETQIGGRLYVFALSGGQSTETVRLKPDTTASPNSLPDGQGQALVERMCTTCHTLDTVVTVKMSRDRWSEVVDDMVARGAQGADREIETVIGYLAKHFGAR
jgi:quinoprotein glucose dehydrogenase